MPSPPPPNPSGHALVRLMVRAMSRHVLEMRVRVRESTIYPLLEQVSVSMCCVMYVGWWGAARLTRIGLTEHQRPLPMIL
eukprot:6428454-Prymnesium_polylepis.1